MASFIDTNIVLYSLSAHPTERDKRNIAQAIFERTDLVLSAQVLSEFYVQATRPTRADRLTST